MHSIYLNIGTNLGDREANIEKALALIGDRFQIEGVSRPVESEPWGFDSPNKFINVCVEISTELTPVQVLPEVQAIEREISPLSHRKEDGSYADRLIDIDIVYAPGYTVKTEELTVPHPHLYERSFFYGPLLELLERKKKTAHAD